MKTEVRRLYEGLFLVDSADAEADWDGIAALVETVLKRADADVVSIRKWDDCRLAYDIKGSSRGTYILAYFRAGGNKVREIERDVHLSERIMRVLVLRADHLSEADVEKETPAMAAGRRLVEAKEQQQRRAAARARQPEKAAPAAADDAKAEEPGVKVSESDAKVAEPDAVETAGPEQDERIEA